MAGGLVTRPTEPRCIIGRCSQGCVINGACQSASDTRGGAFQPSPAWLRRVSIITLVEPLTIHDVRQFTLTCANWDLSVEMRPSFDESRSDRPLDWLAVVMERPILGALNGKLFLFGWTALGEVLAG